jgi:hypothetical protein
LCRDVDGDGHDDLKGHGDDVVDDDGDGNNMVMQLCW